MLRSFAGRIAPPFLGIGGTLHQRRFGSGRYKLVTAEDAVHLVPDNATVTVGGFAGQNSAEEVLKALGDRYRETGSPKNITLIFMGGPGDWATRGMNHLAQKGLVTRTIGAHYGQVPMLADMALKNEIEAYCVPQGSVSRMIRCAAMKQPGHISEIGIGTFIDPKLGGGRINTFTKRDLIEEVVLKGKRYLFYPAIPIDVAIVRGTVADPDGNVTMEEESLYVDNQVQAMAARNNRGVTIAQVKHIAAAGSLKPRDVIIPGTMVDCVVKAKPENHWMSYFTESDPHVAGAIRSPPRFSLLPLDERKLIARRAALDITPGQVVNLGIGMPEGIAAVADEEKVLEFFSLTTEPGVHGGVGKTGVEFGQAVNYDALVSMVTQFDFYNGGGLDIAFLGMGEVGPKGDVNVTRMGPKLTGPGGFIDISQSTKRVSMVGTFTAGGLKVKAENGKLTIVKEGKIKKFVNQIKEMSFSGAVANERNQTIRYITERCVFALRKEGIELIEIAPGIDLEKDILGQMEFKPLIADPLREMDSGIFKDELMKLRARTFGTNWIERMHYKPETNTVYFNVSNVSLQSPDLLVDLEQNLTNFIVKNGVDGKVHLVVNYENFDIHPELASAYREMVGRLNKNYHSVRRFTGRAFLRHRFVTDLKKSDTPQMPKPRMTLEEVITYCKQMSYMVSELAIKDLFATMDKDKTGDFDEDEFNKFVAAIQKMSG